MFTSNLLALVASLSTVSAVYQGFNYGSTFTDGSAKQQSDFEAEFKTAKGLVGASGFTSARLYTTIQAGSASTPIQAIPAAIAQGTSLLLGMWASGGQGGFNSELSALSAAISTYGTSFTSLVAGISVGSEDLYRISPTGIENLSGVGADPDTIVGYITQLRSTLSGTSLSGAPVGHVDTWTAWVNGSNQAVVNACDFIGMDAYPYFQSTEDNSIGNSKGEFFAALDATKAAVGSKPVWITETGWPVSGPTMNQAVPSVENAKTYWDEVGCAVFGSVNTWWYTIQDAAPVTPAPSFGLVGSTLTTTPIYDLTCPAPGSSPSQAPPPTNPTTTSATPPISSTVGGGGPIASTDTSVASINSPGPVIVVSADSSAASGSPTEGSSSPPRGPSSSPSPSPTTSSSTLTTSYTSPSSTSSSTSSSTLTSTVASTAVVNTPPPGASATNTEVTSSSLPSSTTTETNLAPPPSTNESAANPTTLATTGSSNPSETSAAASGALGGASTASAGFGTSSSAPASTSSPLVGGAALSASGSGAFGGVLAVIVAVVAAAL